MSKAAKKQASTQPRAYHYDVILSPAITEKSTAASEQNKVVFNVDPRASKTDIKSAVEALFNVKVAKVNTLIRLGKQKLFRGVKGKQLDVKKAVVTLAEGHTIDLTGGVK